MSGFYIFPHVNQLFEGLLPAAEPVYRVAQKSKLLILAVNEINASQTRVIFAKFISKLVEKMFDICSIVPNYSLKSLSPFVYTLVDERL